MMLTNCPLNKQDSHSCWLCPFSTAIHDNEGEIKEYMCLHSNYDKLNKNKVKPRKIETTFCDKCGKKVKFKVDWEGVAQVTQKGVITYRELYAICKECSNEVYVPAINDINVYRREKAFAQKKKDSIQIPIATGELAKRIEEQLKIKPSEDTKRGIEILNEMFKDKETK